MHFDGVTTGDESDTLLVVLGNLGRLDLGMEKERHGWDTRITIQYWARRKLEA